MRNKKGFLNLNNRGFAITSIIYSMLLLFIILMTLTILTLGRKKVLLDKTKNETLGLFSQLDNYPCMVTEKNAKEINIGIGDVITCKTENFYVISNDGTNIEMLAKYNLNVGDNQISSETEGIQSAKAIGSIKSEKNATLAFSSTNYWSASSSYPTFVYNNNSALYQYVENYVDYLRKILDLPELVGSLINYNKLLSLGCTQNSCTNAPAWVYLTSYWTGTAIDYQHIKYVYNNGNVASSDTYSFANNYGVRPVVSIPTNKVRNKVPDVIIEPIVIPEEGHTGVKAIVYLDPINLNRKCTESDVNSDTGTKTGCMKWYAYADDGTNYTMILDHNTTAAVAWNESGDNSSGPVTVNEQLSRDITGWNSSLNPRLITADEVATIVGDAGWDSSSPSSTAWFYFDTRNENRTNEGKYGWLFDRTNSSCTQYGCLNNASGTETYGYWTSSTVFGNSSTAWNVSNDGRLRSYVVSNAASFGIRPVITVQKSLLGELS